MPAKVTGRGRGPLARSAFDKGSCILLTYIIRRILILIPMLVVISFLVYLGLELTPGDAVSYMISRTSPGSSRRRS